MSPVLVSRQQDSDRADGRLVDGHTSWWFSPTAAIVKWSVALAITVFIFTFFIGGYFHARRRIKKGLHPLPYHRFMVSRSYHAPPPTAQNSFAFYRMDDYGYNVGQAPPPPVYDPKAPLPPTYKREEAGQAYDVPPPGDPTNETSTAPTAELPPREPKKKGGFMQRFRK